MNFTLSQHATKTAEERSILMEWIDLTLLQPELIETDQNDPSKSHAFRKIPEHGDRVLHVVYNHIKKPPQIVTVFFDRNMKGIL